LNPPVVIEHDGVHVVRDDLFPGGTKARFIGQLFDGADEVVYASPQEGGAQTALATVARDLGKRATIFVAKRADPHRRVLAAKALGAKVLQVDPGYLSVVRARAAAYCEARGARLAPFGMDFPGAVDAIAEAALLADDGPYEVWCAGGSGVLARGLKKAWPDTRLHVVEVGRLLSIDAKIEPYGRPFSSVARVAPPFPSDPHYDAKAWEVCRQKRARVGRVLFWNVTGPAI